MLTFCIVPKLKYTYLDLHTCITYNDHRDMLLRFIKISKIGVYIICNNITKLQMIHKIVGMENKCDYFRNKCIIIDVVNIEKSICVGIILLKLLNKVKMINYFKSFHLIGCTDDMILLGYLKYKKENNKYNWCSCSIGEELIENKTPIDFKMEVTKNNTFIDLFDSF